MRKYYISVMMKIIYFYDIAITLHECNFVTSIEVENLKFFYMMTRFYLINLRSSRILD